MWSKFENMVCYVYENQGPRYGKLHDWRVSDYFCTDGQLTWFGYVGVPVVLCLIVFALYMKFRR